MFLERVEALLNHISNHDENWESCRADIVQTRADLLYRHAVHLGSLSIVELLGKLNAVINHKLTKNNVITSLPFMHC